MPHMKTPSRSPILGAAVALLISSGTFAKAPQKAEDKPVPPVPADVRGKGGDAVLDWMLENGYLTSAYLRQVTQEKALAATQERSEGADKNPLLEKLHSDYESLPATAFKVEIKPRWEIVAAKLTPDVLANVSKLENPKIYGMNKKRELLIGDGRENVPSFTLNQNYYDARNATKVQGLNLWPEGEYRSFNEGSKEVNTWTWLESGDAPALALVGGWDGVVYVRKRVPKNSFDYLGALRVLRVKI